MALYLSDSQINYEEEIPDEAPIIGDQFV